MIRRPLDYMLPHYDGARMDRLITRWDAIGIVVVLTLVAMGVL